MIVSFEHSYYIQYEQSASILCFLVYILVNPYILIHLMGNPTKTIG